MRSSAFTVIIASVASLVSSQAIDPDSVPLSMRNSWCQNQRTTCPLLCLQETNSAATAANECDPKTLGWYCVCKNGVMPNATQYSLTIPFHICQEYGNQCVKACGQNNACSDNCRTQYTCGASNPQRVNSTSSSTSAAATGSSTGISAFGGSGANSASSLNLGQSVGFGVVISGVLAGVALVL